METPSRFKSGNGFGDQWQDTDQLVRGGVQTARRNLSERFLEQVLLPCIQLGEPISSSELLYMHKVFKAEHQGLGSDFELSHVWKCAWERDVENQWLAENDPRNLTLEAADVAIAMILLERIIFR